MSKKISQSGFCWVINFCPCRYLWSTALYLSSNLARTLCSAWRKCALESVLVLETDQTTARTTVSVVRRELSRYLKVQSKSRSPYKFFGKKLPPQFWQIFVNETSKTDFTWTFRRIINIDIRHQSSKFEINMLRIDYFTDRDKYVENWLFYWSIIKMPQNASLQTTVMLRLSAPLE